jgi:hypothetical protein
MLTHLLLFHRPFCFNRLDGLAVLPRELLQILFGIDQFLLDSLPLAMESVSR